MMRLKFAAALFLAAMVQTAIAQTLPFENHRGYGQPQSKEYKEALELYEKGIYDRSMVLFRDIAQKTSDENAKGYYVLNAANLRIPGYEKLIEEFSARCQSSGLIPQIRYRYGLNLFDDRDFEGASVQFDQISRHSLFKSQQPEFLFKRAYSDFEMRRLDKAMLRFKDLTERKHSDYTAPAQYAIGYICYERKSFEEAVRWLSEAVKDSRFSDIASFYILESRFMLKQYEIVRKEGPEVLAKVSADRKPHVARFISESCLVLGDVENARKYFEQSAEGMALATRADFFYSGSVLYATKDYQGAIDHFSRMTDRTDSLGQIANYNLGFSFIKTKNKVAAMSAFKDAADAGYDPRIKEDAFFNYAKLAFDLNNDSSVFHDYLRLYKDQGKAEQIYSYIAVAALYNRDYAGAIEAYDQIDYLEPDMKSNYMKANYLRAYELISKGSFRNSVTCLKAAAYYSDRRSYFNQMSRYWLGESYYRCGLYEESRSVFMDLYNTSALYGTPESVLIPYNVAYCYFKEENYAYAANWFGDYLSGSSVQYRKEAQLRYGDCLFMLQRYKEAVVAYDKVLKDYFSVNDIYPYYQAAVSYGLSGDNKRKISILSNVRKASPSSPFYPEAMYELGRSLVREGNDAQAIDCFNTLAANVKDSTFIAKSFIELGMVYRNQSRNDKALGYYKKVVEEMPMTEYADAALLAVESIYKSLNTPQDYLDYIESIGKSSLKSEDEKEMMIFNAAEQIFLSENYEKALASLKSYLAKYPSGKMVPNAQYYMAESYRNSGQPESACDYYLKVIQDGSGSFVEISTLNYAVLSYSMQKYEDAYNAYSSLYEHARLENNRFTAALGMMRASYRAHLYPEAIENSLKVKNEMKVDEDILREAEYILAKSYLATSRRDEAFEVLNRLAAYPFSAEGAEAAFMVIQDSYDRGQFEEVENKVYAFSDSSTGQTYWLAKAFIVLGDSFVERGDLEQAKATFESVAEGYEPQGENDDILSSVRMRLGKLKDAVPETLAPAGNAEMI